jgi:hypothetical protein
MPPATLKQPIHIHLTAEFRRGGPDTLMYSKVDDQFAVKLTNVTNTIAEKLHSYTALNMELFSKLLRVSEGVQK